MYFNNMFKHTMFAIGRHSICCKINEQSVMKIYQHHILLSKNYKKFPDIVLVNNFHQSPVYLKVKKASKQKAVKMEELIQPSEVEDYFDLQDFHDRMMNCLTELKDDYIAEFQVGNDLHSIGKIKINLEDDEYDLSDVGVISKSKSNLISIDLTDFPEAVKPTIEAFNKHTAYHLQHKGMGTVLLVQVPITTAETREKFAKDAKLRMNRAKEDIRHVLTNAEKVLKEQGQDIPKDTLQLVRQQLGIYLKHNLKESENIFKAKEKDLLLK